MILRAPAPASDPTRWLLRFCGFQSALFSAVTAFNRYATAPRRVSDQRKRLIVEISLVSLRHTPTRLLSWSPEN